jgi:hypothetical protein
MSAPDPTLIHRLKMMQDQFDNAQVGGGYDRDELEGIEDGDYQTRVESFDLFQGKKNPEHWFLKTFFSIQHDAELAGRELTTLHNIADPDKIGFLKDHLHGLGVDVSQLDLTDIYPGSDLLNSLLDAPTLVGVYTNKKGFRNVVVRQRLDGEVHSDLGTAQVQIQGFEEGTVKPKKAKPAKRSKNAQAIEDDIEKNFRNKPENCTCPDPTKGQFDEACEVPGHGISFLYEEAPSFEALKGTHRC